MKMVFLTSNQQKFDEAKMILKDWQLEQANIPLAEIQGSSQEIIKAKAHQAVNVLGRPLIVEDVSFSCSALKGFPGPYVKDFLLHLGENGIYELIHKYNDHAVSVTCLAAYAEPGAEPVIFEGTIHGKVVAPRGNTKHGAASWNSIVQPEGFTKTFGEMTLEEHSRCSIRFLAMSKLRDYLTGKI